MPLGHTFRPELRGDFGFPTRFSTTAGTVWGERTLGELLPGVNENRRKLALPKYQFRVVYMISCGANLIGSSPSATAALAASTTSSATPAGATADCRLASRNRYGSDAHRRRNRSLPVAWHRQQR